jgi:SHS2 domain-containing protein
MGYRWVEHTAELELEIEAPTEEAVFADALHALAELLGDERSAGRVSREVTVDGRQRAALLAEWLNQLVYLIEAEDLVLEEVRPIELSDCALVATVHCHRGNPRHLVKGATHHRLAFERTQSGFRATVVLDV